eukprot:TRINITY_DN1244_c0_g1_i1.p1 TRINITY_DN1244_c0_g1~~TRINITY_DN1244_c0_g1_i1.p1  ORF type:complete len:345 (+),score=81.95 TRINITY_DN1244_c0_g1_i1:25-1035(+)
MVEEENSAAFVALVQASAGAAGGVFASFVLQPLEVAKTRIQISTSGDASTLGTLRDIAAGGGLQGLFSGWAAKCTETGAKNFAYFYIYDGLNAAAKKRVAITTAMKLLLGYVAGVGNTLLNMPLEVLSTKAQLDSFKGLGITSVFLRILQDEGVSALYTGLGYNIVLCINPAIQNTTFDKLKERVLKYIAHSNPSIPATLTPLQAFTLGAFAKAVATFVTFPLVRLKTILQAGKVPGAKSPKKQIERKSSAQLLKSMSMREDRSPEKQGLLQRIMELYRGVGSALLKSTLQAALLYMMKDQIESSVEKVFRLTSKAFFRRSGRLKLGSLSGRPLAS